MSLRLILAGTGLLAVASCATPRTEPAPTENKVEAPRPAPKLSVGPANAGVTASSGLALAVVAGDPIETPEFLAHLMHRESRLVFDAMDRLVTARLALLEAGRLNVLMDPSLVDARMAEDRGRMAKMLNDAGYEIERYLVEQLGLDPERYFELMRTEVVHQLLTERVMRAWTLGQERTELSVIVTKTKDEMDVVQIRVNAGEAFEDVAAELSVDPSAASGGVLPPVIRSELSPLSRLAFETAIGATGGPIEQDGHWILIRPDFRPAPLAGAWEAIGPAVEASLAKASVEDPEYWQWRAAMSRTYKTDLSPLLKLAGEPDAQEGS